MKYTNLRSFEKHLESSFPQLFSSAYLINAKEPFDRASALEKILFYLLREQSHPDLCKCTLEGEALSSEELATELGTLSFFINRRVIVIQNADKIKKETLKFLVDYLENPHPKTYLVAVAASLSSSSNFYQKMEKKGVVLEIAPEKPWEKENSLARWVEEKIKENGKKIPFDLCQWIVKQVGMDQKILCSELDKLLCFIGQRPDITSEDMEIISSGACIETIWQLGEAIFSLQASAALSIGKTLIADGTPLIVLIKQLRTQFQTDYQICSLLANGGSAGDINARFPYMKGAILDKHICMAQKYGMSRFKAGMILLDAADTQAKNSSIDPELLGEILIARLINPKF